MIEAVWEGSDAEFVIEAMTALGRQIDGSRGPSIAVASVYCDESGKLADSKFVVFAAAVADDAEWTVLQRRWLTLLREAGIGHIHMVDAMRFRGEFQGWENREADRDGLLEQLATLANERIAYNYSFEMDAAKFRALPQSDQERLKDLPYCAFEGLIRAIAHEHQEYPGMRFQLVYDLSEEYATQCLKLFNRLRRTRPEYRQFFPVLAFADDEQVPALQVADMLAYCRREEVLQSGAANCRVIVKRLLEIFSSGGLVESGTIGYKSGSSLGSGRLRRSTA